MGIIYKEKKKEDWDEKSISEELIKTGVRGAGCAILFLCLIFFSLLGVAGVTMLLGQRV